MLEPVGIGLLTRAQGYTLALSGAQLDAAEFDCAVAQGRSALGRGEAGAALASFDQALALWRGPVLADVGWERSAMPEVRRLEELRLATMEDRLDAALELGRDVVADAEALVAAQPLRERRWCQLMLALYRTGRQVDALRRAQELRALFLDEFGVEPGQEVRSLEERILVQDAALLAPYSRPTSDLPATRFTEVDGLHLAYQTLGSGGSGRPDLMLLPGLLAHLDVRWENPTLAGFYRRLARSAHLLLMDKAGTGLSDRRAGLAGPAQQAAHVVAVLDHAGVDRAVLFGIYDGAAAALLAAASHPDRVAAVVTYAASAAPTAPGFPGATSPEVVAVSRAALQGGTAMADAVELWAPSRVHDELFVRWGNRYAQMGASVGDALLVYDQMGRVDVRDTVEDVACPVLVLHRAGDRVVPVANATWLGAHLPRAQVAVVPGEDSILWAGDVDRIADEIERFLGSLDVPGAMASRRASLSGA
ncbi:MAG TPA: alpha/beta fold hydrolase [Acidimicrobiales bacterium]